MSTELDLIHDGEIAATAPAPRPGTTAAALDMLREHAEMMSAARELGSAMVKTQMVPAAYRGKPDDAAAAILYGAEIGLNPIQSLQQVFPIHGQPAIYARTMVALLKARGFRFGTEQSTDAAVTVSGTSPSGECETSTWTIERAQRAGYTSNKKYETDPQAMLYAKACAEVCRKLAPDVLLGISHTREDLKMEAPEPVRATARRLDVEARPSDGGRTQPVQIRQWQAEQTATNEGQAAAEPPSNQSVKPSNLQASEPPKRRTKKADVDETTALMDQIEGLEQPEDRLAFVHTLFNDTKIAGPGDLTPDQRAYLLTELRGVIADREGRDTVAEATDTDGAEQAAGE